MTISDQAAVGCAGGCRRRSRAARAAPAPATRRCRATSETTISDDAAAVGREQGGEAAQAPPASARAAQAPAQLAHARAHRPDHLPLDAACASGRRCRAAPSRRSRGRAASSRAARRGCRGRATRPSSSTTISSASAIVERRWAMMNVVRPAITSASAQLDLALGGRVDRRGGVVEDQDARVGEDRAGDREALALAAGDGQAALADARVVAVREPLDEVVRLGAARRVDRPRSRVALGRA